MMPGIHIACIFVLTCAISPSSAARFAIIGDFGANSTMQRQVSNMLNRWDRESSVFRLDALLTTGDNNYPVGAMDVMDNVVGQYYSKFMYPYSGRHQSATDSINRFWPVPGNHDWTDKCGSGSSLAPYLTYMPVNNKSYYDVVIADVHFFMLDSDCNEPDGYTATSTQAGWLQTKLSESTSRWKLVLLHHPPYSSGSKGSQARSQWPFKAWGADAVIAGHDHSYERVVRHGGFPYFINGLGGQDYRSFATPVVSGSKVRHTGGGGAQLITADATSITFKFIAATSQEPVIDCYEIMKSADGTSTYTTCAPATMSALSNSQLASAATGTQNLLFKYANITPTATAPAGWNSTPSFPDGAWRSGQTPAGYGADYTWKTTLVDNRDLGGSYLFRKTFCLTQAQYEHIQTHGSSLYVASDDRASVWLNGQALLLESSSTNHEMLYWNNAGVEIPVAAYSVGWNVIAAQVFNTLSSSDAGFDLDIRIPTALWSTEEDAACPVPKLYSAFTNEKVTDAQNSSHIEFKYLSASIAPAGWTSLSFNDILWPSGPTPAGYGPDVNWATHLVSNSATGGTYYFRRMLCLTLVQLDFLTSNVVKMYLGSDNRAIVYVNGNALFADATSINHNIEYWNVVMELTPMQKASFVVGSNVIAVEVYNNQNSSGAAFDFDLRYESLSAMAPIVTSACTVAASPLPSPSPSPSPSSSPAPPPAASCSTDACSAKIKCCAGLRCRSSQCRAQR